MASGRLSKSANRSAHERLVAECPSRPSVRCTGCALVLAMCAPGGTAALLHRRALVNQAVGARSCQGPEGPRAGRVKDATRAPVPAAALTRARVTVAPPLPRRPGSRAARWGPTNVAALGGDSSRPRRRGSGPPPLRRLRSRPRSDVRRGHNARGPLPPRRAESNALGRDARAAIRGSCVSPRSPARCRRRQGPGPSGTARARSRPRWRAGGLGGRGPRSASARRECGAPCASRAGRADASAGSASRGGVRVARSGPVMR